MSIKHLFRKSSRRSYLLLSDTDPLSHITAGARNSFWWWTFWMLVILFEKMASQITSVTSFCFYLLSGPCLLRAIVAHSWHKVELVSTSRCKFCRKKYKTKHFNDGNNYKYKHVETEWRPEQSEGIWSVCRQKSKGLIILNLKPKNPCVVVWLFDVLFLTHLSKHLRHTTQSFCCGIRHCMIYIYIYMCVTQISTVI